MRALLQRVTEASVFLPDTKETISRIGSGILVLVCAMDGDGESEAEWLAQKISKLRIFEDEAGKMNRSIMDTGGSILAVSQFTLAADTTRGNRPGFSSGADLDTAERMYEYFVSKILNLGLPIETGSFRTHMHVTLVNDGPVTIWIDTASR